MSEQTKRTVFLNGEYLPEDEAKVSIFDRGYLMADAIYEYTAVIDGRLIDFDGHLTRLQRSLDELGIAYKADHGAMLEIHRELIRRNGIEIGGVYLQISRGVCDRDFVFPHNITPTIMAFTQCLNFVDNPITERGLRVISVEDGRWSRRDIKSVQLLYTCMAKTKAKAEGVDDAFFVQDGYVTEATASNAFIIKNGRLMTRALSQDLLHGVTRKAILRLAQSIGLEIVEQAFTIEDAQNAEEVFVTASPFFALSVVEVDGQKIGNGRPGCITRQLRSIFLQEARAAAI